MKILNRPNRLARNWLEKLKTEILHLKSCIPKYFVCQKEGKSDFSGGNPNLFKHVWIKCNQDCNWLVKLLFLLFMVEHNILVTYFSVIFTIYKKHIFKINIWVLTLDYINVVVCSNNKICNKILWHFIDISTFNIKGFFFTKFQSTIQHSQKYHHSFLKIL